VRWFYGWQPECATAGDQSKKKATNPKMVALMVFEITVTLPLGKLPQMHEAQWHAMSPALGGFHVDFWAAL
jgi:hypothetical protein